MDTARYASASGLPRPSVRDALGLGAADRRIEILRAIAAGGSISHAAREVGVSYKAAWQALDTLTNLAGVALVDRAVGGSGGGGAAITPAGLQLLDAAAALDAARDAVLAQWATPVGAHPPKLALLGLRTSMRNQWPAVVIDLATVGAAVEITLALGSPDGPRVQSQVTRESAELLALRPGQAVLALCKAMAVEVVRAPAGRPHASQGQPGLFGTAARVSRIAGSARQEVVVTLAGTSGLQLVGFASADGIRVRQRVAVRLAPEAVVLALP